MCNPSIQMFYMYMYLVTHKIAQRHQGTTDLSFQLFSTPSLMALLKPTHVYQLVGHVHYRELMGTQLLCFLSL